MTREDWSEIETIYQAAMEHEPGVRSAYLDQACKGNEQIRREVDSLLALNDSAVLVDQPIWEAVPGLLDDPELVPGTELGPYRIEGLLGAGGMGRVYRARDMRLGRAVALKIPTGEFSERFQNEARTAAALNHPNVCILHDVGPNYLVMELVEGPTLADRIKQGRIPIEEAIAIARQIAAALDVAHERGIVHRDLKPANVKIKPDGTVKVLDFGLAQLFETAGAGRATDVSAALKPQDAPTKGIIGTAAYLSPEQVQGRFVDKRADIWAFGLVLYEMLTGQRLFQRDTLTGTLEAVTSHTADFERVPPRARNLLRRCLEKDVRRRLRDIGDAIPLLEESPIAIAETERRPRWIWPTIAGVALLATVAGLVIHLREPPAAATELVRFPITLPEGQTLPSQSTFAVSPDGRQLTFFATGSDGVTRSWLRTLDTLGARPLAGSETSSLSPPFWSPDGGYIGFEAGGKLKSIDIRSGAVQSLCDVPMGLAGGSWSRDGVIIFGTREGRPSVLMRTSASGGTPSVLTRPIGPAGQHVYPTFLPDGRHFLYLNRGRGEGVYVGSLDAQPQAQNYTRLLASDSNAIFVPGAPTGPGQLLFLRGRSLFAQAFDDRTRTLRGEPLLVADQIGLIGVRSGWGAFSAASTGMLAYREEDSARQLAWVDRGGRNVKTVLKQRVERMALSSDATRAAFLSSGRNGVNIWLLDLADGKSTQLTFSPGDHVNPVWSPDGRLIAFSKPPAELWQKSASGVGEEKLLFKVKDENFVTLTDWSRDGRYLIYTNVNPRTKADIWALTNPADDPAGQTSFPVLKSESSEHKGVLSPDTRWIAYVSDESGREEVYVTSFDPPPATGSGAGGKWRISHDGGTDVRWRRDGKELFYATPEANLFAVEVVTQPVFRMGRARLLFRITSDVWDAAPDGDRFLVAVPLPAKMQSPLTVLLNWNTRLKK
jgi:serine/threonine protein kinase/Tol biopolymer transport system component